MKEMTPDHVVDTWFQLYESRLSQPASPDERRPPSLRDACYASALALRANLDTTPDIIEAFVNGLELGAMMALRAAWREKQGEANLWESHRP